MKPANNNGVVKLNNGNSIVEKCSKQSFKEEMTTVRLNESATLESPNITDENIKNNSTLLVNLFDSNVSTDKPKTYLKK